MPQPLLTFYNIILDLPFGELFREFFRELFLELFRELLTEFFIDDIIEVLSEYFLSDLVETSFFVLFYGAINPGDTQFI